MKLGINIALCALFAGTVLGPVIYGSLFDSTCLVWQDSCGDKGSCWIYDRDLLTWYLLAITVCVKFLGIVSFALALCAYKPPDTEAEGGQGGDTRGNPEAAKPHMEMSTKAPSGVSNGKDSGRHTANGSFSNPTFAEPD